MRLVRWILGAAFTSAVSVGVMWVIGSRQPSRPAIDYQAELQRLTRDAQGVDASASNGWDELVALGEELRRREEEASQREVARDGDVFAAGGEPEPWARRVDLYWSCPGDLTERDARVRGELLAELTASGFMDRLHEAVRREGCVSDFATRNAEQLRAEARGSMIPSVVGSLQGLSILLGVDTCAAMEREDWEHASRSIDSAMRLTRALSAQADGSIWLLAPSCRAQHVRWFLWHVMQGEDVPEQVITQALTAMRSFPLLGCAHVLDSERLSMLEMTDALEDVTRESFWGAVACGSGRGPDFAQARADVEAAYAAVMALRTGPREDLIREAAEHSNPDWTSSKGLPSAPFLTYATLMQSLSEIRTRAGVGGWEITLALAAHAARHGAPPPSLSEIDPAILAKVPTDPCAPDGAYRYTPGPTMRDVILYGVGVDGIDDGGLIVVPNVSVTGHASVDQGDVVFTQSPCDPVEAPSR